MPIFTLSPDCNIKFRDGRILIHSSASQLAAFESNDPTVLAFAASFKSPRDSEQAIAAMPAQIQPAARQVIQELSERQVLIEPGSQRDKNPEQRKQNSLQTLPQMARRLHELAGDLEALPSAHFEPTLMDSLQCLVNGLGQFREQVLNQAGSNLRQELPQISQTQDLKLHLGSGDQKLDGWLQIDASPEADLHLNINRGLPLDENSVEKIYAAHLLEHLYYPGPALAFLQDCRRVLKPGGRLRLVVPDIEVYLRAYAEQDDAFFSQRGEHWGQVNEDPRTHLEQILSYAGAGPDPGNFLHSHKYAYDFATLQRLLSEAGFEQIQRCAYQQGADQELLLDEHSFAAQANTSLKDQQVSLSLFIEAC